MKMNTADGFTAAPTRLHEPTPPASLRATVMARIAREADRPDPAVERTAAVQRQRDLPAWLWSLAGVAVACGASAYGGFTGGSLPDVTSPRIGHSLALIPMEGPTTLAMGLALLVCLAGLLAPLRSGGRR